MRTKFLLAAAAMLSAVMLAGCEAPQIIEEKKDPYQQVHLSVNDIQSDVLYLKSGTKFTQFAPYAGTVQRAEAGARASQIIWLMENERLVPTAYKGDSIIVQGLSFAIDDIVIERFKDCGYSFGVYGAQYDPSIDMINVNYNTNVARGTYAETEFATWSEEMHITALSGKKVTPEMLDTAGMFTGLEKNRSYTIDMYSGTRFGQINATANLHILQGWESYSLSVADNKPTKKGYYVYDIPEDLKSGWYAVGNAGLMKYIAMTREEAGALAEDTEVDMNDPFFTSELERISAYAQAYAITFERHTSRPTVEVIYQKDPDPTAYAPEGVLVSPDGSMYNLELTDERPPADLNELDTSRYGYLVCQLEEAMHGQWTAYITPKDLRIMNVEVFSNRMNEDLTEEVYEFILPEAKDDVTFYANYTGDAKDESLFGYIIYPDGQTFPLEIAIHVAEGQPQVISYSTAYVPAGTYRMQIYHLSGIEITRFDYTSSNGGTQEIVNITM